MTLNCSTQRNRKDQDSSYQIHNAEVFDEDKADNSVLDITIANVNDNAAVEDNSDDNDDEYQGTLKYAREEENFPQSLIFTF